MRNRVAVPLRFCNRLLHEISTICRAFVWRLLEHVFFRSAARARVFDIDVVINAPPKNIGDLKDRTIAAIELIAANDPRRLKRLQLYIDRLVVSPLRRVNGAYIARSRSIYLSAPFVASHSAANIAIIVAHEETHARLDQIGIPFTRHLRPRIEQACARQEIAFAYRLPRAVYPRIDEWILDRERQASLRPSRRL